MATWGPVTVSLGPGIIQPDLRRGTIFDSGVVPIGSLSRVGGTSHVTHTGNPPDAFYDIQAQSFTTAGDSIEVRKLVQLRLTQVDSNWNYNPPVNAAHVLLTFGVALGAGQTMVCTASGTTDTANFCVYGTRMTGTATAAIQLTESSLASYLTIAGAPWLLVALTPLIGLTIDTAGMCGQGPPQVPTLSAEIFDWSIDELRDAFVAICWRQFCECVPGTPTPVPPPVPVLVQPVGFPGSPSFPCDPADLCSSISDIRATLHQVQGVIARTYELATLIQRYELPFAYINGAVHSSLSGQGSFAVSRLVGLRIEVTQRPPDTIVLRGNPPYLFDMGWLAVVDANGLLEEKRLTRDDQVWLPRLMPTALHFQWDLFAGVVVRITELLAEP